MKNTPYQKNYTHFYKAQISRERPQIGEKSVRAKLSHIPYVREAKILDVACGLSGLSKTFGERVWGFDLNAQAVKNAQKNGIQARLADVERPWNYSNDFFDIVLANHIIEHVVNPDKLVEEAKRVLKKGGLFIVATPNIAAWFNRFLLLLGVQPFYTEVSTVKRTLGYSFIKSISREVKPIGHLRIFTAIALKELLELHGFKIMKIQGVEFSALPTILLLLDRLISLNASLSSNILITARKR